MTLARYKAHLRYTVARLAICTIIPAVMLYAACAPGAAAPAKIATSELRTVCKDVEQQPEPDYVLFICDVVDATGIAVSTFAVKSPAKTAMAFRASHAPKN